MATKITKSGPRRIVYAPNAGQVNSAMPELAHPPADIGTTPTGPKATGQPRKSPVFPTPGHYVVNEQGNTVRVSSAGRSAVRPLTGQHRGFQGASTPGGNPMVNYAPRVGIDQDTPTIKIAGSPILANTPLPGNDKRRGAQPVNTLAPYSRALNHGGQAYLPIYKRTKMGQEG